MAKHTYTVLEPGIAAGHAMLADAETGAEVELDLTVDEQRAVIAAGWVEPVEDKPSKKKEG